uniref:Uncharacterized protein n=1 Tax=Anguilla anguilla TaxID=7936 RepID=A0A0E9XZL9_ANGAN
MMNLFFSESL